MAGVPATGVMSVPLPRPPLQVAPPHLQRNAAIGGQLRNSVGSVQRQQSSPALLGASGRCSVGTAVPSSIPATPTQLTTELVKTLPTMPLVQANTKLVSRQSSASISTAATPWLSGRTIGLATPSVSLRAPSQAPFVSEDATYSVPACSSYTPIGTTTLRVSPPTSQTAPLQAHQLVSPPIGSLTMAPASISTPPNLLVSGVADASSRAHSSARTLTPVHGSLVVPLGSPPQPCALNQILGQLPTTAPRSSSPAPPCTEAGDSVSTPPHRSDLVADDVGKADDTVSFQDEGWVSMSNYCRSTHGVPGMQGVAGCAICNALLRLYADRQSVHAFAAASMLPRPPTGLVDRLISLQLTEADHTAAATSCCRFHTLHKNRYELWTRAHAKVRRSTIEAGVVTQAVSKVASLKDDLAQMEAQVEQARQAYVDAIGQHLKQLQKDVRDSICSTLTARAQDWIDCHQTKIEEDDKQLTKKLKERQQQIAGHLSRFEEETRNQFMRSQQKRMKHKLASCAQKTRSVESWKNGEYADSLKEMAAVDQATRDAQVRAASSYVANKVEAERAQKENALEIWVSKMEQLQSLQQDQTEKGCARVCERVSKKMKKVEEEQLIEFRHIFVRFQQHTVHIENILEKVRRGQSIRLRSDCKKGDVGPAELEPFVYCAMCAELPGSPAEMGYSRSSGAVVNGACNLGAQPTYSFCSLESSAFAEFLGVRFPNLRAAFADIDLTGSGRITSFELKTWIVLHSFPGEARFLLQDLDRQARGHVCVDDFSAMASIFLNAGLRFGRPAGTHASTILSGMMRLSAGRGVNAAKGAAFHVALHCTRRIFSFVSKTPVSFTSAMQVDTTQSSEVGLAKASASFPSSPSGGSKGTHAKPQPREQPSTHVTRWAKQVADHVSAADRHRYMKFGSGHKTIRSSTPTRTRLRPRSPEGKSQGAGALAGNAEWCQNLRNHGQGQDLFRCKPRGAPPPRCQTGNLFFDEANSLTTSKRSCSVPRQRSSDRGRSRSESPARSRSVPRQRSVDRSRNASVDKDNSDGSVSFAMSQTAQPPMPHNVQRQQSAPASVILKADTQASTCEANIYFKPAPYGSYGDMYYNPDACNDRLADETLDRTNRQSSIKNTEDATSAQRNLFTDLSRSNGEETAMQFLPRGLETQMAVPPANAPHLVSGKVLPMVGVKVQPPLVVAHDPQRVGLAQTPPRRYPYRSGMTTTASYPALGQELLTTSVSYPARGQETVLTTGLLPYTPVVDPRAGLP